MNTRTTTVSVLLAAVAASLTGCAPGGVQAQPIGTCTDCAPAATATPTATTSDAAAQERRDRQDAETVWREANTLLGTITRLPAEEVEPAIQAVTVDPALTRMRQENQQLRAAGKAGYGTDISYITWPEPIAGKDTAVLNDCMDGSQAGLMDVKTGNKLTVGTVNTPMRGTLKRTPQGWKVANVELLSGTTCTPEQ